jgi:hypothetical protein
MNRQAAAGKESQRWMCAGCGVTAAKTGPEMPRGWLWLVIVDVPVCSERCAVTQRTRPISVEVPQKTCPAWGQLVRSQRKHPDCPVKVDDRTCTCACATCRSARQRGAE